MNKLSLYDHQHYVERGWGGAGEGEPIDCTHFRELVVDVTWATAGGEGIARVLALGTNLDTKAHMADVQLPPSAASYGCIIGDHEVVQPKRVSGHLIAVWRDLPKWVVIRVECLNGLPGDGSALRVAVLGR